MLKTKKKKRKTKIFLLIVIFFLVIGILFTYFKITGKTVKEILPFFQEPITTQSHIGTLIVDGTIELCGSYENVWDKIYVTSTGVINVCAFNETAETGFVNITLGPAGNFTVAPSGFINGTGRGATGGAGSKLLSAIGVQGTNGNNWTTGIPATYANGGGAGGGYRDDNAGSAAGGGGAFGGAGGKGGFQGSGEVGGAAGLVYGTTNPLVIKSGSGGAGNNADSEADGGSGGAGFKVNVGLGIIKIGGFINLTGIEGELGISTDSAAGGGGSGGHLILYGSQIDVTGAVINATGGRGGLAQGGSDDCGGGGGGGGGRIYLVYSTLTNTSASYKVEGGPISTAGCSTDPTPGAAGSVTFNDTDSMFTDSAPQWHSPSTNNSNPLVNAYVRHNINWTEDGELTYAVLEVNGTGVSCDITANVSSMVINGTSNWSNLTWQIPAACSGKTIGWKIYAKDFPGNQTNVTDLQMYEVQSGPADSCTYMSGNWYVNCGDYCNITDNVALGGNNITITGTGIFTTEANITQYNNLTIMGTDSSNICIVRCFKGGCFRAT